jgi:triphosphoribosyl-dephospho-CoA synthase
MNAPPRATIGALACAALRQELTVWPKPGLVSEVDPGSHADMNAGTFRASIEALRPFYAALAGAGARNAGMAHLRMIGRAAERAMLEATGGINTHRGAIFGLGLLCAAAGALRANGAGILRRGSLGEFVRRRWGNAIPGAGGARAQAAAGFPGVYDVGLPAWRQGWRLGGDANTAGVQACFALIATLEDTNILRRGGAAGLRFCRGAAQDFLDRGGVGQPDWPAHAARVHRAFVLRRLSPGGSADLLAMTILIERLEAPAPSHVRSSRLPFPAPHPLLCSRSF